MAPSFSLAARPSLEQLKTLDSLPNLQVQVEEAKQLCNHTARADMILKWLLGKLCSSAEARAEPEAWTLLSTAFQLLPVPRIATLMGSTDLLTATQAALKEHSGAQDLIHVISGSWNILLQLASDSAGASLRAILSVEAVKASLFVGHWFERIIRDLRNVNVNPSEVADRRLLDPAFRLWHLHKPSATDEIIFANNCLVPAAMLYSALRKADGISSCKRKRGDVHNEISFRDSQALGAMLAKHVFLPARMAFLKANELQYDTEAKRRTAEVPSYRLNERLASLGAAKLQEGEYEEAFYDVMPQLLDIALRCSPVTNPRQRLKERPWVEALFAALVSCLYLHGNDARSHRALVNMLEIVRKRAALSAEVLIGLSKPVRPLGDGSQNHEHWKLVAKIVELNANVYTTSDLAERLLDDIAEADLQLQSNENITSGPLKVSEKADLRRLWKDGIMIPILRAFASSRTLLSFVNLWYNQLCRSSDSAAFFMWTDLNEAFAPLVEPSLTETQILEQLDRFREVINKAGFAGVNEPSVSGAIVVLNAFLGGIRNDELRNKIYGVVRRLNDHLFALFDNDESTVDDSEQRHAARKYPHIWSLLTKTFELCHASWAAQPGHEEDLDDAKIWLAASEALRSALKPPQYVFQEVEMAKKVTIEAQCFVACVCSSSYSLSHCQTRCIELVSKLAETNGREALILFPDLLLLIADNMNVKALIERSFEDAAEDLRNQNTPPVAQDFLRALTANAVHEAQRQLADEIVRAAIQRMSESASIQSLHVAMDILIAFPASTLPLTLQESILHATSRMISTTMAKEDGQLCQEALGLLIKILEALHPDAELDPGAFWLWDIVTPRVLNGHPRNGMFSNWLSESGPRTLALLEAVARLYVRQLLRRQHVEKSRSTLDSFLQTLGDRIQVAEHGDGFANAPELLSVIKSTLLETNRGLPQNLSKKFLENDSTGLYIKCLQSEARHSLPDEVVRKPKLSESQVAAVLDALLSIPESAFFRAGQDRDEHEKILDELTNDHSNISPASMSQSMWTRMVCLFRLRYKWQREHDRQSLVRDALQLLDLSLHPKDRTLLIADYQLVVTRFPTGGKLATIDQLLSVASSEKQAAALCLLRVTIPALSKIDTCNDNGRLQCPVLHNLLRITSESTSFATRRAACDCIVAIFREKPFLVTQYTVEATLTLMQSLIRDITMETEHYLDVCRIFTVMLQQHRSRLNNRYHLLVQLLKRLITRLFKHNIPRKTLRPQKQLTAKHARVLARILQLFCNPPRLRRQSQTTDLVDEARKAQARVGQHVQYLLHHYCGQVLIGTLGEGVREALMLGIWALIGAIEIYNSDGIKSLSAAMNNSERAVLRNAYDEYRTFGKWQGN